MSADLPLVPGVNAPYDLEAVKKLIADDLNSSIDIPEGHQGAATIFANGDKIETAVATRLLQDGRLTWDVEAVVSHTWTGAHQNTFGVVTKITW